MSKKSLVKYIFTSALLFVLSASFIRSSFEVLKSKKRLDELKAEITVMEKYASELESGIAYKETDEYIEEKARNDLSLVKPGEEVYVVVNDKGLVEEQTNVLGESSEKKDSKDNGVKGKNWYSWYKLFFD